MSDLFLFAGESSADLHGEQLIKALHAKRPDLDIWGVGGPRMRNAGLRCIMPMEEFQVMGFLDVFLALPHLIRHFYSLRRTIVEKRPKAVLLIDYPSFNLKLAAQLRKKGYRGFMAQYICPSVWAWGKKRIPLMARHLDLLLTILPFEAHYFSGTPLPVTYVGHPLTSSIPPRDRANSPVKRVALFPGGRKKEIERNFPQHLRCAKQLLEEYPDLSFTVSLSHPRFAPLLKRTMEEAGVDFPLERNSYELMEKTDLALAKSGTVTLELALHRVPTVVTYGVSQIDLFLAKKVFKIRLPHYCLVNILYGSEIFPELIGPAFTQEALLDKARLLINSAEERQRCIDKCAEVRTLLGEHEASQEAAEALVEKVPF